MIRLVVLADDFTGALDTGIQFGKLGINTVVTQRTACMNDRDSDCEVLVINTESRHLTGEEACRKVYEISARVKTVGIPFVYKKIDSTFRGNIGAELDGCMRGMAAERLMLVPAYPENKRYTRGGLQYIGETPLFETSFAKDPFNPVVSSKISEIIHSQCPLPVHAVPVSALEGFVPEGKGIYLFDAESQNDLEKIAARLKNFNHLSAFSGCAGFASLLPALLNMQARARNVLEIRRPVLLMCGSVCPVSARQLKKAKAFGIPIFKLSDYFELGKNDAGGLERLLDELKSLVGHTVILASSDVESEKLSFQRGCALKRKRIADQLGGITKLAAEALGYKDIAVFGGDTLLAVLSHLGISELRPVQEIEPGVVLSEAGDFRIISKAGGLGKENVIERILADTGAVL